MREKISGIVTSVVKHSDRYDIVTLFTRERGCISFLSPAARSSRSGRAARILPLAWLEADVRFVGSRELQSLTSVTPVRVWRTLYFNPVKSSLVFFISEFLNHLLRASAPDRAAFDYIITFLKALDEADASVANAHIAFLFGMLPFAGIYPMLDWEKTPEPCWFDMRIASLSPTAPLHRDVLSPPETAVLHSLSRMSMANARRYRFSGTDRSRILTEILRYYEIHLPGTSRLKSLEILRDIFESPQSQPPNGDGHTR